MLWKTHKIYAMRLADIQPDIKNAQQWPGAEKQMLLSCINQMYSLKKTPDPMEKAAFEKIKVSLSTN